MSNESKPLFSEETIHTVRNTWNKLGTDGSSVGKAIFLKLFKDHPTYQSYFDKVKDTPYDELLKNTTFIRHATTVQNKLNLAVVTLDDPEKLVNELLSIGKKHVRFHLTESQFRNVQIVIEDVLKNALQDEYDESVRKSWNEVLSAAIGIVIKGATEE